VLTISEDKSHTYMEVVRWLQKVWISEIKNAFTHPCINHCLHAVSGPTPRTAETLYITV
jgi:hypothetical protein